MRRAGKGDPMTNARFWVTDLTLRAKHWEERATALSSVL